MREMLEALRNISLFSSLTEKELQQVSDKIKGRLFRKNEVILHEEDTNAYMYVILSGKVKVFQTTEDGKESILAIHNAGDFFGEMTLIDGRTMPATVAALEDTFTATISRDEFSQLLSAYKKVLDRLLIILCGRLRESWGKIKMLNYNNAADRMKMLFTVLSQEYGEKDSEGITLNIKLTHQDIANMTGITRETVTRVIDKWQKDKEISIIKNKKILLSNNFTKKDFSLPSSL